MAQGMFCVEIKPGRGAAGGWGLGALLPLRPLPRPHLAMCQGPSCWLCCARHRGSGDGAPSLVLAGVAGVLGRALRVLRARLPVRLPSGVTRLPLGPQPCRGHVACSPTAVRRCPVGETTGSPLGFAETRVMDDPGCLWHLGCSEVCQLCLSPSARAQGAGVSLPG